MLNIINLIINILKICFILTPAVDCTVISIGTLRTSPCVLFVFKFPSYVHGIGFGISKQCYGSEQSLDFFRNTGNAERIFSQKRDLVGLVTSARERLSIYMLLESDVEEQSYPSMLSDRAETA